MNLASVLAHRGKRAITLLINGLVQEGPNATLKEPATVLLICYSQNHGLSS